MVESPQKIHLQHKSNPRNVYLDFFLKNPVILSIQPNQLASVPSLLAKDVQKVHSDACVPTSTSENWGAKT